jgi:hypothetical protein
MLCTEEGEKSRGKGMLYPSFDPQSDDVNVYDEWLKDGQL